MSGDFCGNFSPSQAAQLDDICLSGTGGFIYGNYGQQRYLRGAEQLQPASDDHYLYVFRYDRRHRAGCGDRRFCGPGDQFPDGSQKGNDDLCHRLPHIRTDFHCASEQLCGPGLPAGAAEHRKEEPDQPLQAGAVCNLLHHPGRRRDPDRNAHQRVRQHGSGGSGTAPVRPAGFCLGGRSHFHHRRNLHGGHEPLVRLLR